MFVDLSHRIAIADDVREADGADRPALLWFGANRARDLVQAVHEFGRIQWLDQEIAGPGFQGLNGHTRRVSSAHHDDRELGGALAQGFEERDPCAGHVQVHEHQLDGSDVEDRERRIRIRGRRHPEGAIVSPQGVVERPNGVPVPLQRQHLDCG